jgi:hypothetical protein
MHTAANSTKFLCRFDLRALSFDPILRSGAVTCVHTRKEEGPMDTSNAITIILIVIGILVIAEALVWLVVWLRYPEYRYFEFHPSRRDESDKGRTLRLSNR